MDDAYLGGGRPCGTADRGSENKILIVEAVSLNESGHLIHARIRVVNGFSSEVISNWAKRHLAPGSKVIFGGLAYFYAVATANCHHKSVVTDGKYPNELPQFRWINTLLGNLKTSFCGTFHPFNLDKYARRYLGGNYFRFNRRFSMSDMTERISNAVYGYMPIIERDPRDAELCG